MKVGAVKAKSKIVKKCKADLVLVGLERELGDCCIVQINDS